MTTTATVVIDNFVFPSLPFIPPRAPNMDGLRVIREQTVQVLSNPALPDGFKAKIAAAVAAKIMDALSVCKVGPVGAEIAEEEVIVDRLESILTYDAQFERYEEMRRAIAHVSMLGEMSFAEFVVEPAECGLDTGLNYRVLHAFSQFWDGVSGRAEKREHHEEMLERHRQLRAERKALRNARLQARRENTTPPKAADIAEKTKAIHRVERQLGKLTAPCQPRLQMMLSHYTRRLKN